MMPKPAFTITYRARYYNPGSGRFLQVDPIGFAGGMNLYAYVGDDPVDRVDPDGLHSLPQMPGTYCVTSCHPSERGETPKAIVGGSLTVGTFTESIDQTKGETSSQSSQLVGVSMDITLGDKGDIEAGIGARHTGIGLNFNNDGKVSGLSVHYGWSWPPSFTYGSVSKK